MVAWPITTKTIVLVIVVGIGPAGRTAELGDGAPLAYYPGRFGRLQIADDDSV